MTPNVPPLERPLSHSSWGATDVGIQRARNEDGFFLDDARGAYLVVDGMGGEAAGDVATEIARQMFVERIERDEGTPEEQVREGIALGNNAIVRHAQSHPGCEGMGCVLTGVLVEDDRLIIGHVGDTRMYRVSADGLQKLTRDHSPVGEREERGELSEAEAMRHPARSVVDRALGTTWIHPDDDLADIFLVQVHAGDRFLLCSDGVTDQIEARRIFELVWGRDPKPAVRDLLLEANHRGGIDNATAILLDFQATPAGAQKSRRIGRRKQS